MNKIQPDDIVYIIANGNVNKARFYGWYSDNTTDFIMHNLADFITDEGGILLRVHKSNWKLIFSSLKEAEMAIQSCPDGELVLKIQERLLALKGDDMCSLFVRQQANTDPNQTINEILSLWKDHPKFWEKLIGKETMDLIFKLKNK